MPNHIIALIGSNCVFLTLPEQVTVQITVLSSLPLPDLLSTLCFSSLHTQRPHDCTSPLSTARCCQLQKNSCSPRSLCATDTQELCKLFQIESALFELEGSILSSAFNLINKPHVSALHHDICICSDSSLIKQSRLPYITLH